MYKIQVQDIDLGQITESGQCFRWNLIGKNTYSIIAFDRYLEIRQEKDEIELSCDKEEFEKVWRRYLDLDTDYHKIKERVAGDLFLENAVQFGGGIRILRQEFWEILVSFIISQRKSITAIRGCVEKICTNYGLPILGENGEIYGYSFPKPSSFLEVTPEELRTCGVGYRAPYILAAARWYCECYCQEKWEKLEYLEAKERLKEIHGVGEKVANCICLFALHQTDACPIDVWVQKIIDQDYKKVIPKWMTDKDAGILQQYAFYYKKNGQKNLYS